jgi:hypothetical protein
MTTSQLIECILGKKICVTGKTEKPNATAFEDRKIDEIGDILVKEGFNRYGYERLYNGLTGEMMEGLIFIGPTYYQRLKHMVQDKYHCLTMDHEVLTLNGWKTYDNLTLQDRIATLEEGKLVYRNPTDLHYYPDYSGKIIHIKNGNIDCSITYEHRVCIKDENNTTKLVKICDLLKQNNKEFVFFNETQEFKVSIADITIEETNTKVFCVTVPSGVFYVRRNGKTVWTGNSRGYGP